MSLSIYIDQTTQDLDVDTSGQLVDKNSLLTEMYARLSTPIGSYRYDENFGSVFPGYIQNRQTITINKLRSGIENCLLPMIVRGSIVNIAFNTVVTGIGYFIISLNVTDSNANTFVFPYSVQG